MYDQSINSAILNRFLYNSDFDQGGDYFDQRVQLIKSALEHLNRGTIPDVEVNAHKEANPKMISINLPTLKK